MLEKREKLEKRLRKTNICLYCKKINYLTIKIVKMSNSNQVQNRRKKRSTNKIEEALIEEQVIASKRQKERLVKEAEEMVVPEKEKSEYHMIENTPFHLVRSNGKYVIVWLNYFLIQPRETAEEAMECFKTENYEIMAMYMMAIMEEKENQTRKRK